MLFLFDHPGEIIDLSQNLRLKHFCEYLALVGNTQLAFDRRHAYYIVYAALVSEILGHASLTCYRRYTTTGL